MAELVLPSSVDFSKKLPSLPDGVSSNLLAIQSTNGIGPFGPSSVIQFDLPARSNLYLDGKTMFIRFKITATSGGTAGVIRRKPVYTVFQKLDEFVGSQPINSVYNYHAVANMWVDTNMSQADIYGQQYAFGLQSTTTPTLDTFDGYTLPTTSADNTIIVAAPVVCSAISSADHLIPTGLMAPLRIQFTVAALADITNNTTNLSAFTISNPELCIQSIDMPGVDNIVAMSAPKLFLKTTCWANNSNSLASGTSGFNTFIYNHRYESIENLYFICAAAATAKGVNGPLESFDITGGSGTVQFQIGQQQFPLIPINTTIGGGKASILQYLRECVGGIQDQRNSMSINSVEFSQLASGATASTAAEPAKCYFAVPLSKIQSANPYQAVSLLSGVSAASTPINVLVNIGTATNSNMNLQLVAQYTSLIEIDPMSKQVRIVQ
jgi:hypothetical protein